MSRAPARIERGTGRAVVWLARQVEVVLAEVGFQSIHVELVLTVQGVQKKALENLIVATKRSCIIYQTLKVGIPISFNTINTI